MNDSIITLGQDSVCNAPLLLSEVNECTLLEKKISDEIDALESVLKAENERLDPSIELLAPTLRSVIRSRKRMLLCLNSMQSPD